MNIPTKKIDTRTPEQIARALEISKKILATKAKNKEYRESIRAYTDSMLEQACNANRTATFETNYCSSGLNGFHEIEIYYEPSMSDDCYGFGDIKVQQTLDEDIESLYAYYEDYIF